MPHPILRFTLSAITIYLASSTLSLAAASPQLSGGHGTHVCGVIDGQSRFHRSRTLGTEDSKQPAKLHSDQFPNRHYAQSFAANLHVGEPRTVRMIYFTPNDWPYRADIVQKMKDTIHAVQTFYAEQMDAHGYGRATFRFETDPQGEPMVHRVDGQHPFSHYDNTLGYAVLAELEQTFNLNTNVYFIVLGTDALRQGNGQPAAGVGSQHRKNAGWALVPNEFSWDLVAHELGHAFGLEHDFRDGAYLMSYGPGQSRLSTCAVEFLSVHPYFNPDTPIKEGQPPTIELLSSRTYPPGSTSIPVRVRVSDSDDGIHQVLLHAPALDSLQLCRKLTGKKDAIVEFEYDGRFAGGFALESSMSFSSAITHTIRVDIVDTVGNVSNTFFTFVESSPYHITTLSGHTHSVESISFSPDGRTLAAGSWGAIELWDMATETSFATLRHENWVYSVSFSPDGGILASGGEDGTVKLWDTTTGASFATLRHGVPVYSVSFSPDGRTLATGGRGAIELWDVATETSFATLRHGSVVYSVSFSPDGGILASGGEDGSVKLWDTTTGASFATLRHGMSVYSVSFSPDERTLATGGRGAIELWDVATETSFATLRHRSVIYSVSFSPDGTTLASGTAGGTVELWDVTTGAKFATFPHTSGIYPISFSPDGRTLASGTAEGTVELWDMSMLREARLEAVAEIDIPDPNLRAAIASAFGKPSSAPIVRGNMATLTRLEAWEASISNLTGLEAATNLKSLELWSNSISDISPVAGLTNLTSLELRGNNISDISPVAGLTNLTSLNLRNNNISDISPVAGLTNLTSLNLGGNSISDISPVAGLTNLTLLQLRGNNISDISPVAGLTDLIWLELWSNNISDISPVAGLTSLTWLQLANNNISNISPLVANTGLGSGDTVSLEMNPLSYLSVKTHSPTLQDRGVTVDFDDQAHPALSKVSGNNQEGMPNETLAKMFVVEARDARGSPLAGVSVTFTVVAGGGTLSVTNTTTDGNGRAQSLLTLGPNLGTNTVEVSVEGISQTVLFRAEATPPLPIPTTLEYVSGNNQSGLTGEALMQPFVVEVHDQYDDPMEGVTVTFAVSIGGGSMSDTSVDSDVNGLARSTLTLGNDPITNTVEVSVEGIAETVTFHAVAKLLEFDLALPSGISLVHVPLKVTAVDGAAQTIESIADLYDVLGGTSTVNFLITYDSSIQEWRSFFVPSDKGTLVDRKLTDDMGIIAGMRATASVRFRGDALGTDGSGTITLNQGLNVVGLPLRDSKVTRVSDLFALDGIGGNVPVIILTDGGEFKVVGRAGDPGDIEITGGQSFILTASQAATVAISGDAWVNDSGTAAAPPVLQGVEVGDTTPVLELRGTIVDEGTGLKAEGFRITVKNLSTGRAVAAVTTSDEAGYRSTVVDIETGRAATIGDILEISAQSPNPFIGAEPLRYTVTAEDVKQSLIQLPNLVTYKIPAETELLPNYPNPFNPETWIPYRLAEDAIVTLTIYDSTGQAVRTLDVGHQIASAYESRSKAVYWDGRNGLGEKVASSVYFYHLSAGDYSATRKMVILK